MRITKDEARIIAIALAEYKFSLEARIYDAYDVIDNIEQRVSEFSEDNRRNGRMSMDTTADLYKRLKALFKLN